MWNLTRRVAIVTKTDGLRLGEDCLICSGRAFTMLRWFYSHNIQSIFQTFLCTKVVVVVVIILFLGEAHERLSNIGVPHLLVDVISANNARYCDKESASGGHFLYWTLPKMAAEYAPISQEGSNFRKKTVKKLVLPPKFRKVRFEMHEKFTNF